MGFLKKSIITFATSIGLMIIGMASGIIIARMLGPELKGQSALLASITEFLFMGGSLGMGSSFSFFIAKKQYPSRHILSCALFCSLILGFLAIGVFYLTMPLHNNVWEGIPKWLIFCAALLAVLSLYANYLVRIVVGYGRITGMNLARIAHSLANVSSVVFFVVVMGLTLDGVMISFWLSLFAQLAVLLYVLRADLSLTTFWSTGLMRNSLAYGLKSHSLLLINFLNYRIDMLLLRYFTDATTVGYYSLAVGMAEMMWMVPNSAVAPLFSGVAASDIKDKSLITLRTVRWSLILLIFLALLGILFGRYLIQFLYGINYLPSYMPFLWLLPGICLFPIYKLLSIDLAARGRPGLGTISSAVALVVNIIANIILIPRMGGAGASLATSLSYICMSIITIFFFVNVTKNRIKDIFIIDSEEIDYIKRFIFSLLKHR